jgi:hypothetical protein
MQERKAKYSQPLAHVVWLRWITLLAFLTIWLGTTLIYPSYFQRDDADELVWSRNHTVADCFIPTQDAALAHDGMYRPLRELPWLLMFRMFGLNSFPYHFLLGLVFIFSLFFLFKLAGNIKDDAAAYLTIFVWLGAFQFLLTTLFWFSVAVNNGFEILLATSGLYCFISGFGKSASKVAAGCVLMFASFLAKEAVILILPVTIATFIATQGRDNLKWNKPKTAMYSLLALLSGPLYLMAFPFVTQRMPTANASLGATAGKAVERIAFYGHFTTDGITGVILLTPAIYIIIRRFLTNKSGIDKYFALALVVSVSGAVLIAGAHWYPAGIIVLLVGALAMPRRYYFLGAWIFVPFLALCFFRDQVRTYLYELSLGATLLTAIQMSMLAGDLRDWWIARVTRPVITYAVMAVVLLSVFGCGVVKAKGQLAFLRDRSDVVMSLKDLTPSLRRLPAHSTVVVVDYASEGISDTELRLFREARKIRTQASMLPSRHADNWTKIIGRGDLRVINFRDYIREPRRYLTDSKVFLWLMTAEDHKFAATLKLDTRDFALVRRGSGKASLLQLN